MTARLSPTPAPHRIAERGLIPIATAPDPATAAVQSDQQAELRVRGPIRAGYEQVLTPAALHFVARLAMAFEPRRQELLARRRARQAEIDAGRMPDFLPETRHVREGDWTVAPIPDHLLNRRVEITGPVDRKMIINALNSGANVFMADFEDSTSPTWDNVVSGQINLCDAVRRTIRYVSPQQQKVYELNERTATLMVRPRGWHLDEKHVTLLGRPVSASLLDFGLYFYQNVHALLDRGTAPYFYLPKLQSHLEARLWNDVFNWAQDQFAIPRGTIRATVLIETILAAFEMDEILYELREHSAGLNCGRWDYIFSVIKTFRSHRRFVLPDRSLVTMTTPFMRSYSLATIRTCHRRGIHAIGGMAAQIPIKNDPTAHCAAIDKVRADKAREVADGHDGTWVAHPGLVTVALEEFASMRGYHQIDRRREDVRVGAGDLLAVPEEPQITERGLRTNISVGVRYLESWLGGQGCVPINHLMEDAATAEISRAQLWQWVRYGAVMRDGRTVTAKLVERMMDEEVEVLRHQRDGAAAGSAEGDGHAGAAQDRLGLARELFLRMTHSEQCPDFLTSVAYEYLE